MATSAMKTLIDDLVIMFKAGITAGNIHANKVFKGLQDAPAQTAVTEYPYIMIDDGGERTEPPTTTREQTRIFSIVLEMGTYSLKDVETALDDVLDLTEEVKIELEKLSNRQLDDFTWGLVITPFGWESETEFFRGRHVVIDYNTEENMRDLY